MSKNPHIANDINSQGHGIKSHVLF